MNQMDGHDLDPKNQVLYIYNNELQSNTESPSYEEALGSLSPHFGGTRCKYNESAGTQGSQSPHRRPEREQIRDFQNSSSKKNCSFRLLAPPGGTNYRGLAS